jgi:hypothetical protein
MLLHVLHHFLKTHPEARPPDHPGAHGSEISRLAVYPRNGTCTRLRAAALVGSGATSSIPAMGSRASDSAIHRDFRVVSS